MAAVSVKDNVYLLNGWDNVIWPQMSVLFVTQNLRINDDKKKENMHIRILIVVVSLSTNVILDYIQAKEGNISPAV